jgi:hypothetical protein
VARRESHIRRSVAARSVSDQLRESIEESGLTSYALGKLTGIDPGILARFRAGTAEIRSGTLDLVADELGLRLVAPSRARGRPVKAPAPPRGDQPDG